MHDTKNTFQSRSDEINKYIDFLAKVDPDKTKINVHSGEHEINSDVKKILKANTYILLYNLVESTVRNSMAEIYDHLNTEKISFDDIRDELKKEVIRNLRKHLEKCKTDEFTDTIKHLTTDIIHTTFNSEHNFNGNIDAKLIKKKAQKMGLSLKINPSARGGVDLLSIKSLRNSLAHGDISFCECGKDKTPRDIKEVYNRTHDYLMGLIQSTETYLKNTEYLKDA